MKRYFDNHDKISILSPWGLKLPLEGPLLKKAMANHLAIALLEDLSGTYIGCHRDDDVLHPIHTIGYFNDERSVEYIAGQMKITQETLREVKAAISAGKFTADQFSAIKSLLSLYP